MTHLGKVMSLASQGRIGGVPGSIGECLDNLKQDGVITIKQWHTLLMTDTRRSAYELKLIQICMQCGMETLEDDIFEVIQRMGSKYFHEAHSPLARFI